MTDVDRAFTGTFGEPDRSLSAIRVGQAVVACAYIGYLGLLVTCDLLRVAPGFVPLFRPDAVVILQRGARLRRRAWRPAGGRPHPARKRAGRAAPGRLAPCTARTWIP